MFCDDVDEVGSFSRLMVELVSKLFWIRTIWKQFRDTGKKVGAAELRSETWKFSSAMTQSSG